MHSVIFMGSPEAAVPALRALAAHPLCRVAGVFTQPDRPVGRGRRVQPCPVAGAAQALGLPVHQPARAADPEVLETLRVAAPALLVVCAYGHILPDGVLAVPARGAYNLHFSLLPRWRGASPVQAAILAGDTTTGVTLQRMVRELDAGPIAAETPPLPIFPGDTAGSLTGRLAEEAARLLTATLPELLEGDPALREQDAARATFCRTIRKEAGRVDWGAATAAEIERRVRAYDPWPGCHAFLGELRLGLGRVEPAPAPSGEATAPGTILPGGLVPAKEGWLRLLEVKPAGKGSMPFAAFVNGAPWAVGARLTPEPDPPTRK